jgi:hypothetical protein
MVIPLAYNQELVFMTLLECEFQLSFSGKEGAMSISKALWSQFIRRALTGATFVLAVHFGNAHAVPLAPGGEVTLRGTTVAERPELAGEIIVDVFVPFENDLELGEHEIPRDSISGLLQERIVREESTDTLDFYFRIFLDDTRTVELEDGTQEEVLNTPINLLFAENFAPWATDVDWRRDSESERRPPDFAFRSESGASVGFEFSGDIDLYPVPWLEPGVSHFFFIKTNARRYTEGLVTLHSPSGIANPVTVAAFAPEVAEPSSLFLVGIGLLWLGRWRRAIHPN